MIAKMTASSLLLIAMEACAVGPDYVAPETNLAPFHNLLDAPAGSGHGEPPPLERWWSGFNDPTLVTVVQRALDQNLDLAAALARVDQSRAAAARAGAQLLPTIDFGASSTFAHQSLRSEFGSAASGSAGFKRDSREDIIGPSASWEIDLFGGLRRGEAAARGEAEAAEADRAGTRVTVVADTADAYLQIRGYQARLAVAENQIATDAHLVELVRSRRDEGTATGWEIAQAEALLEQARSSVPPLRIALEQQMNRLDVLLGAQPGAYSRELGAIGQIPSVPAIPGDRQPTDVLRRRPDIIAAERRLAASNERIGAALSDYYPKISLSGALGFDSLSAGHLFTSDAFQAMGGGALRWRLFDFGKINADVARARGANAEALAVYRQAVLRAAEDVENALATLSQTGIRVIALQAQVQDLVQARDLSEQAYSAGSIALTDVLDADRQLLTAQDELNASQVNAARAAVAVFRALGGGWSPPDQVDVRGGVS
jgi:NodT family efflux transporter outer membrane factor (OMF) lipoprotein